MNNEQAREMSVQELADLEAIMADGDSNDQYIAASIDNVRRLCQTVSSRDTEIRQVLEGLSLGSGCWCPAGQIIDHTPACLAARTLYAKLNGSS